MSPKDLAEAVAQVRFIGGPWDGTLILNALPRQWAPVVFIRISKEPLQRDRIPELGGRPVVVNPRVNADVSEIPPGHRYVRRWFDPELVVYVYTPIQGEARP